MSYVLSDCWRKKNSYKHEKISTINCTQIPSPSSFTRTVSIVLITATKTPCSTGLVTEEPKLSVKTVDTDSGGFITFLVTILTAVFFTICAEFANWTGPLTLPRFSLTSLRTTTTGVVTEVSVKSRLTAFCTGSSNAVAGRVNAVYITLMGTVRSVVHDITTYNSFKTPLKHIICIWLHMQFLTP